MPVSPPPPPPPPPGPPPGPPGNFNSQFGPPIPFPNMQIISTTLQALLNVGGGVIMPGLQFGIYNPAAGTFQPHITHPPPPPPPPPPSSG